MTESHATVHLGGPRRFVEIRMLEVGDDHTPAAGDVRLGVTVGMDGFDGRDDQLWVTSDDWRAFLASLAQLERDRRGQAVVESMSPDEFSLRLRIEDAAGRLAGAGGLSERHLGHRSGSAPRSRIEYMIDLDPSMLRSWVEAFASLSPPVE